MCVAFAYSIVDSKFCLYHKNLACRIEIGSRHSRMKECLHFQRNGVVSWRYGTQT